MSASWDLPRDDVLGDVMVRLAPASVLGACREQLTRVDDARRQAWHEVRVVEALYHPQRYVRLAYALVSDPSVPGRRLWPEADIVYVHAPVRRPVSRRGTIIRVGSAPSKTGPTDVEVEAYRFPNDRRLRGLRRFAAGGDATRAWQDWLDRANVPCDIDATTLQRLLIRYVPEQKWVVRLRAETVERDSGVRRKRRIAVRCASTDSCSRLLHRHSTLVRASRSAGAAFSVPEVVGARVDQGILAVEWDRGQSLVEALSTEVPNADACGTYTMGIMKGMAAAVAAMHATQMDDLELCAPGDISSRSRAAASDLSLTCPDLRARIESVIRELEDRLGAIGAFDPVTLHNDLHWNQVRIKRGRFTLLDLERMARGDPLIDVANLATQLRMLGVRVDQNVQPDATARWVDEFLEEWSLRTGQGVDSDRFRCYAVWSLLGLAQGMMRHLREGWRVLVHRCIESSEIVLASANPVHDRLGIRSNAREEVVPR